MNKTNLRITICTLGLSLIGAAQPSKANQWSDMFKNMLIPPSASTSSVASDSISARETQLANRIVDAINNNKLSPADTQNLKGQLDRFKAMEANYRASGTLGPVETASINSELTKIESSFNQMISTTPGASASFPPGSNDMRGRNFPGSISDERYPRGDGRPGSPDWNRDGDSDRSDGRSFDLRQANVLRRIEERAASGRLTSAEAADLRADYRRLEQLEASYRADGSLSPYEVDVLQRGLDSIVRELKDESDPIASQYPEIDRKQAELKQRIDNGVARRLIKGGDAQKLNDNLNWIASIESGFRQSGGRLDKSEADRILADLDRLSAKIDRFSISPVQDLFNRKTDLQRRIDSGTASGKLSPRTLRDMRKDLDRISYSLQSPSSSLPPDLVNRISADLDRLNAQLNTALTYGGNDDRNNDWHDRSGGPRDWGNH